MVAANTALAVVEAPPVRPPLVGLIPSLTGTPYLITAETETVPDVAPGAPALRAPGSPPQRWEAGIQYAPEQYCYSAGADDPCSAGPRTIPTLPATVAANSILVWAGDECSTFGWQARDYRGRAIRALEAVTSEQIAHELWTGRLAQTNGWPNPYLASSNAQVLDTGGAVDPGPALALLEHGIALTGNGQQAMIHVTRQLGAALSELGNTYKSLGDSGRIMTYMGNVICPDTGYVGTGPTEALPSGGHAYAYATLMPTVRLGPVDVYPDTYEEATDRAHNTLAWYAQRVAVVDFPPCTLIAVQVNLPTATTLTYGS